MTRVKSSSSRKAKHKKILTRAKGYRSSRSKLVRTAKEAVMHAEAYAYAGRRDRKRQKNTGYPYVAETQKIPQTGTASTACFA